MVPRLHVLQELQDAVSLLQCGNKASMDQLLTSWHSRLKAIEVIGYFISTSDRMYEHIDLNTICAYMYMFPCNLC